MKFLIPSIFLIALVGVVIGITVFSATQQIDVIVKSSQISVAVSDGSVNYGAISLSGTQDTVTLSQTQYAGNTGNGTEDFNIIGFDSANWQISTDDRGSDIYMHWFATDGGTNWTALGTQDGYVTLVPDVSVNASKDVDLRISMPNTDSSSGATQDVDVTIQAVEG